jgi:O-antigen/teichoic acid export membrane protein
LDKEVSNLLLFGSKIVRTNLLNWIIENLDNILIGRFFGSTQLGLYSVTYNLVRTPVNHLVVSLQGVMFPLAARIKEREKQLSTLFYAFISIISIATFPIFISVSSLSELILNALYGDEWILASKVLIPISLAMPLHAIMAITGPLLWGIGRVEKELNIQLFIAIAFSISMLIACQISMVFAAWTVLFIYAARAIMMIYILSTVLQIERAKVLNNIKGGILLGIMVSASLYIINFLMDNALSSPMFKLLILIVFGALTLLGYSYLLRRFIITEEIVYLLESISNQSSEKVKQLIEKYLLIPTR